ncbi:phospholipase D-like domain-containing protein [Pontibacter pudoricolor]|uniref:phospholipase D-like domain-containing protein n=1 Tax=Pontibacter pudoricolor TaxID=2694930 RepID=UPI00139185BF|nr:phospholipase D-like domain-containing protein [Pontibacter pudoricolor]
MANFITGKELEEAVYNIIWNAKRDLMIVSPYIKLDDYFKNLFKKHLTKSNLHITLIFGKNEDRVNKSLNKADLEFFLQFPNISIVYVPNLHAKYYANDEMGVVTSINLYDFSFKHNLEFGVLYENKLLNRLTKSSDNDVWDTCMEIAMNNAVVYVKRPVYEKTLMGLSKNYLSSKILVDRSKELYAGKSLSPDSIKLEDFEDELYSNDDNDKCPTREEIEKPVGLKFTEPKSYQEEAFISGYCIRTGVKIPFNPKSPFSYEAYKSWVRWSDEDFKEKYCHYSGEPSKGETSMRKPILHKNWKKASEIKK